MNVCRKNPNLVKIEQKISDILRDDVSTFILLSAV